MLCLSNHKCGHIHGDTGNTDSPWLRTIHLITTQNYDSAKKVIYDLLLHLLLLQYPCGYVIKIWALGNWHVFTIVAVSHQERRAGFASQPRVLLNNHSKKKRSSKIRCDSMTLLSDGNSGLIVINWRLLINKDVLGDLGIPVTPACWVVVF